MAVEFIDKGKHGRNNYVILRRFDSNGEWIGYEVMVWGEDRVARFVKTETIAGAENIAGEFLRTGKLPEWAVKEEL